MTGRKYILDGFSFADIAMAATLQMVRPVADNYLAIGPATRDAWTDPELSERFADLLAWRDALYREHRFS
jgi:glutathione S-transferase